MIQLSDLIALCIRHFLEIEKDYKPGIPEPVRQFYAKCFNKIDQRVIGRSLIDRNGRNLHRLNSFLSDVQCNPRRQWRRAYDVQRN